MNSARVPYRIRLLAPSGRVPDPASVARAVERLQAAGHELSGLETLERQAQRFAGTDAERAADFGRLSDPSRPPPDIALAVRGGYGAMRLLHHIDFEALAAALARRPTALVGHSDFTAIQLALLAKSGAVSFAGPMLTANFGAVMPSAFTRDHFWGLLESSDYTIHFGAAGDDGASDLSGVSRSRRRQAIDVQGPLWGSNLSMLAALCGTEFMPEIDGGILFVEDVNEHPYRVERMLLQLCLAGVLPRQHALVLGAFTGKAVAGYDHGFDMDSVVERISEAAGIPVITGLPFGHIDDMVTLPIGARASLRSEGEGYVLRMSGYPQLRSVRV